ncbi:MAG: yibD [Deltaproteobacteria bacterium]|nr:yibD [Deltaproteobacteria bacterium]
MRLSVVIPVHNGGESFRRCLNALAGSTRAADEVIIVNDASTDKSVSVAVNAGYRIINADNGPRGPSFARNLGANEATGDMLIFLDADVAVHDDTLGRIETYFEKHPEVTALFGSYDDNPPHRSTISLYKNLQHHYVHQTGKRETFTFWTGCGAVKRGVFTAIGGFDETRGGPVMKMEDVEFGMRMSEAGHIIMLLPDVQVTHFKKWTAKSWIRTEIINRAIPWSKLLLSSGKMPDDLNMGVKARLSALAAWFLFFFLGSGFFVPLLWIGAGFSIAVICLLNRDFYHLLWREGGNFFVAASVCLHIFYFLYSSAIFGFIAIRHLLSGKNNPN